MNKIIFGKPSFSKLEQKRITDVMSSGWVGTGSIAKQFEQNFVKYKKAKYGIALNSCTSALQLALILSNVGKGDEVIVTSLTFCSTVNTIVNIGAKPILVDINLNDFQINENLIENKITKKTKAILVVHMHGYPCNMQKIMKIKEKYSLKLIEDCAHAIETKFNDKHVGTFGEFGCFSFYSTKNITTVEGGFLICKNKENEQRGKILSLHGMTKDAYKRFSKNKYIHYDVNETGYKFNMPDINAILGIEQLRNINKKYNVRKKIWDQYQKAFKNTKFILPPSIPLNIKHAYHIYSLRIEDHYNLSRDQIMDKLHKMGIGTGLHYKAISDLHFYKKSNFINKCDKASIFGKTSFSIPLTPYLTNSEVKRIVNAILNINKLLKKK